MYNLKDTRNSVMDLFGYTEPQRSWDRLRNVNLRHYMPSRNQPVVDRLDGTSLIVGVAIGVALGFGLGLALKDSLSPAVSRARQKAKKAYDQAKEQVPARLNITRMEESQKR